MASLLVSQRGVFAARTVAPVRSVASACIRSPLSVVRPSQTQSTFVGGFNLSTQRATTTSRGALLVAANAKKSMGCTKEGTNKKRRTTSGFRTRMQSPNGRKVLKARMKKGRHVLCPASQKKSGGKK